jgi:hypothetical protein
MERTGPGQNAPSLSLSLVIATAKTAYLDVYSIKYRYYSGSNLLYFNDALSWQQLFVYSFVLEAVWCNDFFLKKIGLSCVCVDDWEGMVWERKLDHLRGTIDLIMGVRWWRCVDAEQRSQTRGRSHQNLNVSVEEANP